jgi:hypothetical protein
VYRAELPAGRLRVTYQVLEDERVILVSAVDLVPRRSRGGRVAARPVLVAAAWQPSVVTSSP